MSDEKIKPGYKRTEVGVIPDDWSIRTIDCEVERLEAGVSVNSVDETLQGFPHEHSILKTSAVANGKFFAHEAKKIAPNDIHRARLTPKADRIIVSRMNTPDLVGECGYVAEDYPALFLPDRLWMTGPRLGSNLCTRWLAFLLSSAQYKRRLKGAATGTSGSMKNLSKDAFLSLPIPFPTAAEQRAIAAALSDVDALLAKLDQLIAKKRDLKQATMLQLLTGQTRLPGFLGEWEVKQLGDVALLKNGYIFKSETYSESGKYRVITIANVQDGFMRMDNCNSIDDLPSDLQSHQLLDVGDLLLSMTGNVGRVCQVTEDGCLLNQRVGKIVARYIEFDFLYAVLSDRAFQKAMTDVAKGGAQPNLSAQDILSYPIKLPKTQEEQRSIAIILSDMEGDLKTLETRRWKTQALKEGMMQELLTGKTRIL